MRNGRKLFDRVATAAKDFKALRGIGFRTEETLRKFVRSLAERRDYEEIEGVLVLERNVRDDFVHEFVAPAAERIHEERYVLLPRPHAGEVHRFGTKIEARKIDAAHGVGDFVDRRELLFLPEVIDAPREDEAPHVGDEHDRAVLALDGANLRDAHVDDALDFRRLFGALKEVPIVFVGFPHLRLDIRPLLFRLLFVILHDVLHAVLEPLKGGV